MIPAQEREVINQIVQNSARICKLQNINIDNVDGIPVAKLEAENIRLSKTFSEMTGALAMISQNPQLEDDSPNTSEYGGDDCESQDDMQLGQGTYVPNQEELNTDFPPRNQEKLQIRSSVMLVSSYWHGKYHANKVNELMEASFSQDEMFEDMSRVSTLLKLSKV